MFIVEKCNFLLFFWYKENCSFVRKKKSRKVSWIEKTKVFGIKRFALSYGKIIKEGVTNSKNDQ